MTTECWYLHIRFNKSGGKEGEGEMAFGLNYNSIIQSRHPITHNIITNMKLIICVTSSWLWRLKQCDQTLKYEVAKKFQMLPKM